MGCEPFEISTIESRTFPRAVSLSKKSSHTICFTKSSNVNIDACTELDLIKKEYDITSLSIVLEK